MKSYLFATTLLTTIFVTPSVASPISVDEINQLYQEQISPSPLGGNTLTQEDLDLINYQSQYLSVFENTDNILSYDSDHNCQAGDSSACLPMGVYNILGANELTIGDLLSESLSANDFRNATLLDSAEQPHGFDQQTLINYCSLVGSCYLAHNNDPVLIGVAGRLAYLITLDLHYVGTETAVPITHQALVEHPQLYDLYKQIFQELVALPPQELLNGQYKSKIIGFIDQLNFNTVVPSLTGYLTERLEQSYYDVTEQTIDTFMVENPEFDPDTTFGDLLAISPVVSDFFSSQKLYDVFGQVSIWDDQELSNHNSDYIAASKAIAHIPGASNYDANNLPVATMAEEMIKGFMADTIYKYSELLRGKIPNQPLGRVDLVLADENYAFNTISGGYGKNQYVKGSYGCINYKSELPGMSFPRQQLSDQGGELGRKCSHIELQPFFKVNNPDGEFKLDMGTPGLQWVAGDAQQVRGGKNFPLNQMFNRHEPTGIPIPLEIQETVLTSASAGQNGGGDLGGVPSFSSVDDLSNMMNTNISVEELKDLLNGKTIEKYAQIKDSMIADFKQMGEIIKNGLPVPISGNPTVKMLVRDLDESTGTAKITFAFGWCVKIYFYETCTPNGIVLPGLFTIKEEGLIPFPLPIKRP